LRKLGWSKEFIRRVLDAYKAFHQYIDGDIDEQAREQRRERTMSDVCLKVGEGYDKEVWNFGNATPIVNAQGATRAKSLETRGGEESNVPAAEANRACPCSSGDS